MRVEYLLAAVALSIAVTACGSDSGNVMSSSSNDLDPAVIDAALGPEPGNDLPANDLAANEDSVAPNEMAAEDGPPAESEAEPPANGASEPEGNAAD